MISLSLGLAGSPALAADKTPEELARDGLAKLLSALDLFIGSIPQYETPEILPNGDIIIRRIHPQDGGGGKQEQKEGDDRKESI